MVGKLQEVPVFSGSVSPKSLQVFQLCVAGSSGCWGESVGLFLPTGWSSAPDSHQCCSCSPCWFDSDCGHVQLSQEKGLEEPGMCNRGPPSWGPAGEGPPEWSGPRKTSETAVSEEHAEPSSLDPPQPANPTRNPSSGPP